MAQREQFQSGVHPSRASSGDYALVSVKRIRTLTQDGARPVELHLATHGFSTGLTEAKDLLKTRKPTDPHPLVDLQGFRKQMEDLQAGAEKRLVIERQRKAN
jgi:metallo-beta-lactamase class B